MQKLSIYAAGKDLSKSEHDYVSKSLNSTYDKLLKLEVKWIFFRSCFDRVSSHDLHLY
jgi:hypothetical protein